MSQAEYIEILSNGTVHVHFTNALYMMFAYIVAMYLAARTLDRFEALSITAIYSIALMFPTNSVFTNWQQQRVVSAMFREDYPETAERFFQGGIFPTSEELLVIVLVSAWLLSLAFTFKIRLKAQDRDEGS